MYSTHIHSDINDISFNELNEYYNKIFADKVSQIAKGGDISVAVLDSGVDMFHDKLRNRIYGGYNAAKNNLDIFDQLGHGTYITGLINGIDIGLAKNVKMHCIKVTDDNFKVELKSVLNAIEWCIKKNIDIVCMPFSSYTYNNELDNIIKKATNVHNIIFIASAGNNPKDISYPAKYEDVISVGSIDYCLQRAEFSGTGAELDMVAPGVQIPSLYSYNRYAVASGSSPSTAIATSLITIIQQLRINDSGVKFNLYQLRKWIRKNLTDLGELGYDNLYGYGIIDFKRMENNDYKLTL